MEQECAPQQIGVSPNPSTLCRQSPGPGCTGCMSAVPRILAHVNSGSSDCPVSVSERLEAATLAYTALKLPYPFRYEPRSRTAIPTPPAACPGQILGGDPDMALLPFLQHGVPTGAVSALPPSLQWPAKKPRRHIWKFVKATGRRPKTSQKPCKVCCARKLPTTGLLKPALA